MATPAPLTPTSYALLGLLAVKPRTTYELAQQMDRTLSRFWPRARSKLYEEPKKLVDYGLARATEGAVGRRARTVYRITPKGRRAVAAWVARPGEGPVLEYEQLVKVFFAESGSTADLRRTLRDARAWAHERTLRSIDAGRSSVDGHSPAVGMVVDRFLDDFLEMVDRWAEWADGVVSAWPDEPGSARPDRAEVEQTISNGVARAARWRA